MVRGEQLRRTDAGLGDHAELRGAARERHRPLHDREPSARREDRLQGLPGNYWRKPEHNLKEIIFTSIASDATRVAALLSGDVDVIEPVPIQDIQRVNSSGTATVLTGPEIRTIFIGMDMARDELLFSNIKGKNPFKDIRVREAFYKTIDVDLIKTRVMRGMSTPSTLMIAPELYPLSKEFTRPKLDPEGAKKLLADAGYPNGFEVTMDCPNDRYVNDAQICQAVVGMLARIGVKVNLQRPAQGAVLRQGAEAGRLPDLVLPARLDPRRPSIQPQRALRHPRLP
jgi:ABC-type transport system substrate-binding protein